MTNARKRERGVQTEALGPKERLSSSTKESENKKSDKRRGREGDCELTHERDFARDFMCIGSTSEEHRITTAVGDHWMLKDLAGASSLILDGIISLPGFLATIFAS